MTPGQQAALDLIDEMQPMLMTLHDSVAAKDAEIASLNARIVELETPPSLVAFAA